jgi:phage shock protein A
MRLLERIAVLLKADAHGVVESLEERGLLLKQYLREAEVEVDRNRARLESLGDETRALRESLDREEKAIGGLDEDISLALAAGKEDLARFAIRQLLPRRAEAAELAAQIERRQTEAATLAARVEEQQRRYEDLQLRVRADLGRRATADRSDWIGAPVVAEEEVEIELMRRRSGEVVS